MFVRNRTKHRVALARGHVTDKEAIAALSVECCYSLNGELLAPEERPRRATDPPDIRRTTLWRGTSVTAFGHVSGPARAPYRQVLRFAVGERALSLVVTGERQWLRHRGALVASEAVAFTKLPLCWSRAFGGTVDVPPGYLSGTEVPHPGGRTAHPVNPGGRGFAVAGARVEGLPLPNIEAAGHATTSPYEMSPPAGCAPCPQLPKLRATEEEPDPTNADDVVRAMLRSAHHAPGALVFEQLKPETTVALSGGGVPAITLVLPTSPVRVALRHRRQRTPIAARIRSVHLDFDVGVLRVTFAHVASYRVAEAPRFVHVADAA